MAHDDRDRTFEKALARHLRLSAAPSVDSNAADASLREVCPDPETLAAYHDGSLSPDERNLWKQHVVGCESCQLVLAHLETPLDIPVNVAASESVPASQAAAASSSSVTPSRVARPSPLHRLRWLWLVPAGAIAATLIAWISLREQKPLQVAQPKPVEVAENREPSAASPVPSPAFAVPSERKEKDQSADKSVGGIPRGVPPNLDVPTKQLDNKVQLAQQAPNQNAARAAHGGPSLSMQQQQRQQASRIVAGSAGAELQDKEEYGRVAPQLAQEGRNIAPQSPPPPPAAEPSFLSGGTIPAPSAKKASPAPAPPPAPNATAPQSPAANADAVSAMSETVEVTSQPQSLKALRGAVGQDPRVFSAPGGKQLWRIGPAGSLEFSKDRGAKWTPQFSGVITDLTAGSASSGKVCWIVGHSGTILRTTDGGAHWIKLDSPLTSDLAGVRATDALHASVWSVPDQRTGLVTSYQTPDGGVTWVLVPNE